VTPEGKVKAAVKLCLASYDIQEAKKAGAFESAAGWYYMPGQRGYGVTGIPDFIGHYKGYFFAIETKAPGKVPEGFQSLQIEAISRSGGYVFIIDGEGGLSSFRQWLNLRR